MVNEYYLRGLGQWRLVQLVLHTAERVLGAFEYVVTTQSDAGDGETPASPGPTLWSTSSDEQQLGAIPKLLNLRHLSSTTTSGQLVLLQNRAVG